jgi:hypothetical protein
VYKQLFLSKKRILLFGVVVAMAQKVVFFQAREFCPFVQTGCGDHTSWDPVGTETLFPRGEWPEH